VQAFKTSQIAALNTADVFNLTTAQVQALTSSHIAALTTTDLQAIGTTNLDAFTTSQIQALTSSELINLTTTEVNSLLTTQLQALTTTQIHVLTTTEIQALGSSGLVALTTTQIAALTTADVVALTTDQVQNLTTTQITAFTTAEIQALNTTEIQALTTDQAHALTMTQLNALTSTQVQALTTVQLNAIQFTPLVLDLDDKGIHTVNVAAGTSFDMEATGHKNATGWISSGDGFLVLDVNHDGKVNDGSELFGNATKLPNGLTALNGFAALAALDSNHDGVIDAKDASFSSLEVWTPDSSGVSGSGQLHSLSSLGVVRIDLNTVIKVGIADNGNVIGLESTYATADGKTHTIADVWFQEGNSQHMAIDLSTLNPAAITAGTLSRIDMSGYGSQGGTLSLNANDVQHFGMSNLVTNAQTGANHVQMVILGNASDTVDITDTQAKWVDGGTTQVNDVSYHIYTSGTVQLLVQSDIHIVFS
jgi:hypothetical protein